MPQFYASATGPAVADGSHWGRGIFSGNAISDFIQMPCGRPALHNLQEISGENAGEIGQLDLRFVRRGVCCCSAVAKDSPSATVALLGRFLPRLGPLQKC